MTKPTEFRIVRGDQAHGELSGLLIWDADPLSLLTTAGALHSAGHRCVCARSSAAAIAALSDRETSAVAPVAMVVDVGDDADAALETIEQIRAISGCESMPVVLLANPEWSGLERRVENMTAATRVLYKPIDPFALIAVVNALMSTPTAPKPSRSKGARPARAGWVTL